VADAEKLIGESAGKIAHSNLPQGDSQLDRVVEAACTMWERLMSAWLLEEVWNNGATVWVSPDGDRRAIVSPRLAISFEYTDGEE
jgi:hypothetical protein